MLRIEIIEKGNDFVQKDIIAPGDDEKTMIGW
jgi:hypothetical protein